MKNHTTTKSRAAATLGKAKSEAKSETARENGRKGGRPTHRYYRVEAPREGAYGMEWSGTVLAVRADGTGYLLTDRYEVDRNGAECYRQYVGDRLRNWPKAAERAVGMPASIAPQAEEFVSMASGIMSRDRRGDWLQARLLELVIKLDASTPSR